MSQKTPLSQTESTPCKESLLQVYPGGRIIVHWDCLSENVQQITVLNLERSTMAVLALLPTGSTGKTSFLEFLFCSILCKWQELNLPNVVCITIDDRIHGCFKLQFRGNKYINLIQTIMISFDKNSIVYSTINTCQANYDVLGALMQVARKSKFMPRESCLENVLDIVRF